MAATGQFVQERIPVPLSVPDTARMLLELVTSADGSVAEQAGPMTWRVVRRYRPTWATVLAFLVVPLLLSRTPEAVRMSTMGARPVPQGLGGGAPAYGAGPEYGAPPAYGAAPAYGAPGYGAPAYGAPAQGAPYGGPQPVGQYGGQPAGQDGGVGWATSNPQPAPPDPFAAPPAPLQPMRPEPVGHSQPPAPSYPPPAALPGQDAPPYAVPLARGNGTGQPVDVRALRDQAPFEPALQPSGGQLSENGRAVNGHHPAPDTTAMAPPPQPLPRVEVAIDTGEQAMVPGLLLIGRAPTPAGGDDGAGLLPVNDPSLSVSKTHLAVGVDRSGVWVQDRNSTNGSWLDEGVGQLRRLEPGIRTPVPPGTRVMIGERVLTLTRR